MDQNTQMKNLHNITYVLTINSLTVQKERSQSKLVFALIIACEW